MSDEFESINSRIPDLSTALAQRIAARTGQTSNVNPPPGTVDPYKLMVQRKQGETTEINMDTIKSWPEADVKKLEDYCAKVGVVGFNCGRMHPIAALALLKQQFGEFADIPLAERLPAGYEKMGTPSGNGQNYPYSQAMAKKQILHG
jgi:hypothetical protein